jgi:hypothetical protein
MNFHSCYIVDDVGRRLRLWRCPLPADGAAVPAQLLYQKSVIPAVAQRRAGTHNLLIEMDSRFRGNDVELGSP